MAQQVCFGYTTLPDDTRGGLEGTGVLNFLSLLLSLPAGIIAMCLLFLHRHGIWMGVWALLSAFIWLQFIITLPRRGWLFSLVCFFFVTYPMCYDDYSLHSSCGRELFLSSIAFGFSQVNRQHRIAIGRLPFLFFHLLYRHGGRVWSRRVIKYMFTNTPYRFFFLGATRS